MEDALLEASPRQMERLAARMRITNGAFGEGAWTWWRTRQCRQKSMASGVNGSLGRSAPDHVESDFRRGI